MSKIVVITGAGSGIGRAAALAFAARGDRVVLAGRRAEALEETRALLADPALGLAVPADVTDAAAVAGLFEAAVRAFGRVDVLFNNAGAFGAGGSVDLIDPAAWRHLVEVNLTGSFLAAAEAFRRMKAQDPQGGRIINNGSISAHHPRPFSAAYTATKHAITGLTKSISLDGRPFGITCGQIDIGNAATGMTGQMAVGMPQADGTIRPEPLMDVARAAEAVVFMAHQPPEADISFLTIAAAAMPFVGRG
ncbi:SDR family oxidoreductase [Zavarzinia compransoris]|uniref:3-oxoacyl-ACP reductase n=1 Tax=Zavarzinia compransoris TaxID=1264899 RepID=A0A317E4H1_9PROT|nr:SDR family oxidoreductase [Zavarzinia compransoris]PWR21889.1 3-oxoacyl-ACP reductase [Zavarzinia compransoris]TDP45305.1 NADP-dependent 3-hydroxy acid dehydrogenase YdfG [Zavarzinia compransoris]